MNGRKLLKFNMYRTVQQLCEDNKAIIEKSPGFMMVFNDFCNGIKLIQTADSGASAITTGITADKNDDKETLCTTGAKVAGFVFAYASRAKNNTLKASVDFSYSTLNGMRKEELLTTVNNIYTIAIANQPAVADFGANPDTLTKFQALITTYSTSAHSPRLAQTNKSTHFDNLDQYFKDEDIILSEQMDKLVKDFENDTPDFVSAYGKARMIMDGPSGGGKPDNKPTPPEPPAE